jgi:hypothetical protein
MHLVMGLEVLREENRYSGHWRNATSLQLYLNYLLFSPRTGLPLRPVAQHIFRQTRPKASSDPKDNVFALFSILKEPKIPFPQPDYRKLVECIYTEAAVASINYDQDLSLLLDAPNNMRNPNLPSWVPDWSVPRFEGMDPRSPDMRDVECCASRFAALTWKFSPNGKQLSLLGIVIDAVEYLSESMDIHPDLDKFLTSQRPGPMTNRKEVRNEFKPTSKTLKKVTATKRSIRGISA